MKKILSAFILSIFILISGAEANPIRVGVADFVNRSSEHKSILTVEMTEIFMKILTSYSSNIEAAVSKSFQSTNSLTAESAINAGKSEGFKYIILGALMSEKVTGSTINKPGFLYSTPIATVQTHTINIALRLIEVDTGKIILSVSGGGSGSLTRNIKDQMKISGTEEGRRQTIEDFKNARKIAFSAASSMAAEKICVFLTGEYSEVTSVKAAPPARNKKKTSTPSTITINRGTSSGVSEKTFYRIFYEGQEIYDSNGKILDKEKFNIAVAEVTSVKTNSCIANITGGIASNIRKGDKAEQITPEEAQLIIDNNDFVQKRARNYKNL